MSAKKIRSALGLLQDDPDSEQAWSELRGALGLSSEEMQPVDPASLGMTAEELAKLLASARRAHEMRREYDAVARLLEMEVVLGKGTEREAELLAELARVLDDELLDDERAVLAYEQLLKLRPGDTRADEAVEKSDARRKKWSELVLLYAKEAKEAGEGALGSSLLVSAAETAYRYGRPELQGSNDKGKKKKLAALLDQIVVGLKEAIEIDPKNRRAALLLERVYRESAQWEELAASLEAFASDSVAKEEKVAGFVRLARVLTKKLGAPDRAIGVYERVIDLSPGHPEATSALVDYFTSKEMWDHLVALYDEQLTQGGVRVGHEAGAILQIAMVHWKMRGRPDAAEPYFERLRKTEPAHPGMLSFFREWAGGRGEATRLVTILTDAQRAMPDGPLRSALSTEIAKLAEEGANATKAIEQWRALLRQDAGNNEARDALKRLYRQTAGWNALADLLRTQLERIAPDNAAARLPVLKEIATVYRENIKSDSALVTVLSQIIALDPANAEAVRELARVYESLGRWRDLLTTQTRLAELETEKGAKAELYRAVARRWLDQFANVQNAMEAYEKLHEVDAEDDEATAKLKELYTKRRAYKPLYDLLDQEAGRLDAGAERRDLWTEMAKLAAERLDRGADALKLYKKVLAEDSASVGALDALEKQAERDKDFATVAEVLEKRADILIADKSADQAATLTILQKLGAIYSDRLHDHSGAVRAWRRVLQLSPGHAKALRVLRDSHLAVGDYDGLSELYAASNDWEGLVEVLSSAADKASDPTLKVDLSFRAADVYAQKLKIPERAFRAYERILGVRPDDSRAASALVPLYEKEGKWARLPALYEVLLGHAKDNDEKLELYAKLATVTGEHLQDRAASFGYSRLAYEAFPDREGALDAFEGAARAAGEWDAFLEVVASRLKAKRGKKEDKRVLRAKLAKTYAELGRVDDAIDAYRALVEEDDDDETSVQALDQILRSADKRDDLRWLFELRVERSGDAAKIELFGEWASLEEISFGAADRAVAIYRRILEIQPQHGPTLRALSRLLRAAGDAEGAAEVLEKDRDQRQGADRAAREVELARLYMGALKRPGDALAAARRSLDLVPNDPETISVVEELLNVGETRAASAVILEQCYGETKNTRRQAEVLQVRIATAAAKGDRIALFERLAEVHEQLGDVSAAFHTMARAAAEFPMELELWDRLGVLANRTHKSQAFVDAIAAALPPHGETSLPEVVEIDLSERAATLYDEMLGEIDRAQPYLERILVREPSNDRAFARLKQILTTRERWSDLEGLYERAVAVTEDVARRTELMAEVALIAEEITGDKAKAIGYYERILAIDKTHEHAIRALDGLYAHEQRWEKLADLLVRRLGTATFEEGVAFKLRLGTLHFQKLGDPKTALGFLEEVLEGRGQQQQDARDLVEKCLEVPELRARAAGVLEGAYAAREEIRDLVRVLEIRLEFAADPIERRELLRRVAELRDERLTDDPGAFDVYARLVPLSPNDVEARQRMLEISRRIGAHERAAAVLVEAAAAADAPQPRGEILRDVAKIYEDLLHDSARAESIYKQVLALDPEDAELALPAARALARIYAVAGKHAELSQILRVQVKLEDNGDARRELHARLGELCEKVLDDPRGAIEAWKARVQDDPADVSALAALDRLYERTQEWRALVDVLRARERLAVEQPARKQLMLRTATTLAEKLSDVTEAILAYRALVDDFGPERSTLAALEVLYEVADRWQDLAETLELDLSLAEVQADRLSILARLGTVRQSKLDDVAGAIEAHRQALALEPSHALSREALEALLVNTSARREAASILRPLYEADKDNTRLLRVLDIEAEYAESPPAKLLVLAQAVAVAEGPLADNARAFAYASRALRESSGEAEFPTWLARAERLAEATGRYADLVELLRAVVPDILEGDLQLDVTVKIAELAKSKIGDTNLARGYYVKALDLKGDDPRALEALEHLYAENNDATALMDVLKRRADAAENDTAKKGFLYKQARLSDETLKDPRAAIEIYEQILEIAVEDEGLAALERLYTASDRYDELIALYERQLALPKVAPSRKAAIHHQLGEVLETRIRDIDRAFDQFEAALALEPYEPTVIALERLMGDRLHAARAAEMLEAVYLARLDWRKVMTTLEVRLDASEDPEERRTILRRLVKLHEEQEEDYKAALEMTAKLFAEDVTDEGTWAELERLARVGNAEARLADIFGAELEKISNDEPATARLAKRTGELYEQQKNVDRALVFYRRAHAFAPEEEQASFAAIDRLLREANRPADRVELYRAALDYRDEPKVRLETHHTIAEIQERDLKDDDAAIETLRAAVEIDDGDARALESLARLYARRERWRDLADLHRRRAEQAALPEDEARFRMELGRLLEHKLSEPVAAIDEYQTVVTLTPPAGGGSGKDAVRALEALLQKAEHKARIIETLRPIYEQADDWEHLISLNDERLVIAADNAEKISILRETAQLWEERGKNLSKAFDACSMAFVLDPDDGETRGELDRLAEATKRWDELTVAYEKGIAITEGVGHRELLSALARVHDRRRDDPRRALEAWDRLFKLDETDVQPLEEMDALATLLSDWPTLVRVLSKRAELTPDDAGRASTWRRIGEARRDMLEDSPGAIDAYERALELESDSAFTIDNLIALYEAKNEAPRLVDLYRRRVELCGEDDDGLKYQLLLDAAHCYEFGLNDRREAIRLLTEALLVKHADPEVMRRLDTLYTTEKMWPELLENLKLQGSNADTELARRTLTKRIGGLLASELDDPARALAAFASVVQTQFDEDAARAIRAIGESRDELRLDSAAALEPVLRAASRFADLADVLEMRLRAESEPADRATTLRAIAGVAESHLGDAKRASNALLRALAEQPDNAVLHEEIERIADQLGEEGWRRYAEALGERAGAVFDATVTTDLYVRLGRAAEEKLKDDARAARAYMQAAEQGGDNAKILGALDRLFGRLGDARALADVLERRIALESESGQKADLYHRLASLQIKEFGEKSQGLATLRLALEKVPDHADSRAAIEALLEDDALFEDAFEAVEWVYRALGRSEDLAKLYERRVVRAFDLREKSRARIHLAKVLEEQVGDKARAQRMVETAVGEDPSDPDVLSELERLAEATGGWREAAAALTRAVVEAKDLPSGNVVELWIRLAGWHKNKLDDTREAEAAFARAWKVDPDNVEILRSLEEIQRAPGRERDLVETLRTRAKLEADLDKKRALLREAKGLAEGVVADRALAEATLRDLLAEDEADRWALAELTKLREVAEDHSEVVTLLLRRAELLDEPAAQMSLKHAAATVITERMGDTKRAISLYEEIMQQEPRDEVAARRLRELYRLLGREKDLAKLLGLLIENAESVETRSSLRIEMAKLQDEKFDAPRDAVDTLRAILDEDPSHNEAVAAISQLLEKTGQDEELAELLSTQIVRARDRSDGDGELALQVRLGEVFESRLKDTPRALETYEQVLVRDPVHQGALLAVARLAESRGSFDRAASALAKLSDLKRTGAEGVELALRLAAAREKIEDVQGVEDALKRALEIDAKNTDVRGRLRALYEKGKKWGELADLLVGDANLMEAEHSEAFAAHAVNRAAVPPSSPQGGTTPPTAPTVGAILEHVKLLRRAAEIHVKERNSATDAVPLLEKSTALVPHDRELLMLLCDAYTAASRERDATVVLERVIASFGGRRTKELSLYHHRLGKALAHLGDKDIALAQYDMAFKIDPGSVSVLRDLGVLALETNDLERAQKTFKALLLQRLDPSTGISKGEVFYYLGEISAKQGDKVRAVQMLERAIENEPSLDRAKAMLTELKG